ncbi:MAG: hypothetical protein AB7S26_35830 [Sandaracinaceae bacterium]
MRARGSAVAIAVCLSLVGSSEAASQACQCAAAPRPVPECTERHVGVMTVDAAFADRARLNGRRVTVRGVLHPFASCVYAERASGECEQRCSGQVALIARRGAEDQILYLGEGVTTGPFGCAGGEDCPCCAIAADDRAIVDVTGVLRDGPTLRLEAPTPCRLPQPRP